MPTRVTVSYLEKSRDLVLRLYAEFDTTEYRKFIRSIDETPNNISDLRDLPLCPSNHISNESFEFPKEETTVVINRKTIARHVWGLCHKRPYTYTKSGEGSFYLGKTEKLTNSLEQLKEVFSNHPQIDQAKDWYSVPVTLASEEPTACQFSFLMPRKTARLRDTYHSPKYLIDGYEPQRFTRKLAKACYIEELYPQYEQIAKEYYGDDLDIDHPDSVITTCAGATSDQYSKYFREKCYIKIKF